MSIIGFFYISTSPAQVLILLIYECDFSILDKEHLFKTNIIVTIFSPQKSPYTTWCSRSKLKVLNNRISGT